MDTYKFKIGDRIILYGDEAQVGTITGYGYWEANDVLGSTEPGYYIEWDRGISFHWTYPTDSIDSAAELFASYIGD